jgi:hypothetical protein
MPSNWIMKMFTKEGTVAPFWMQDILNEEASRENRKPPKLTLKYMEIVPEYVGLFLGGYTNHSKESPEIAIIIGKGKFPNREELYRTLLHEIAHWAVGKEDDKHGGHTARFYANLTEKCLRHNLNMRDMIEEEMAYMGDNLVYEGLSLFHNQYNV